MTEKAEPAAAQPYFKFWVSNHQAEPLLKMCSWATRAIWVEMLCLMHGAEPRGHLLVNGKTPTAEKLARLIGATPEEVQDALNELEAEGVFSRTEDGTIYSRRMVRDTETEKKNREYGKRGGNPALTKKKT